MKYILLLLILVSNELLACSCVKLSMEQKYEKADYIAIVKAGKTEKTVFIKDDVPHQKVSFSIIEVIKGLKPRSYLYSHNAGSGFSGFCGGEMKSGNEYVVFLDSEDYTSICSGTFLLKRGNPKSESMVAEINELRNRLGTQNKALQVDR